MSIAMGSESLGASHPLPLTRVASSVPALAFWRRGDMDGASPVPTPAQ